MFKVPVIQALYGLSDAQAAFQIMDRRTLGRFLSLDDGARAPDETTIRGSGKPWCGPTRWRNSSPGSTRILRTRDIPPGYLAMGGQIVDATIVAGPAPAHDRCREGDRQGHRGMETKGIPPDWQANPRKPAQKDRDARWTLKPGRRKTRPDGKAMGAIATPVFGCKSHINADRRHGFVRTWIVTDAARHDGRVAGGLPDQANTGSTATGSTVRADTAYRSQKNEKKIARAGLTSKVHFRRPPASRCPCITRGPMPHGRRSDPRSNIPSPG